jgi:xanthine/uracil/vitamin C permease (AzgA family)
MRSVVAFYRARPLVGVLVFVIGLAITIATVMLRDGGGVLLPVAMCAVAGLIVGSVLAVGQRRRRAADSAAALDPTDPRDVGV